jgi:hypothetical protein
MIKINSEVKLKGRPVNINSVRQQRLAKTLELKSQGVEIKRGRPSTKNTISILLDNVVEVVVLEEMK